MPRKTPGPPCAICGKPSVAKKLCATHYKRWSRHGHLKDTRPPDWGQRETHPLNDTWRWTRRIGTEWEDFWDFVKAVGDRPNPDHRLRRYDVTRPFGPDNFYWSERVASVSDGDLASRAAYAREWRAKNPLLAKGNELMKMFGITLAEYDALLEKQGGTCAICGSVDKWFSLAVDHCHGTKKIRGLLCSQCNRGLGLFKDRPDLLDNAAAYLRR